MLKVKWEFYLVLQIFKYKPHFVIRSRLEDYIMRNDAIHRNQKHATIGSCQDNSCYSIGVGIANVWTIGFPNQEVEMAGDLEDFGLE